MYMSTDFEGDTGQNRPGPKIFPQNLLPGEWLQLRKLFPNGETGNIIKLLEEGDNTPLEVSAGIRGLSKERISTMNSHIRAHGLNFRIGRVYKGSEWDHICVKRVE